MPSVKTISTKLCAECGQAFGPVHGKSKYCAECAVKVRRRQTAERTRRWRARMKEATQPV